MLLPFTTICPDQSPVNVVPMRVGLGREEEMMLDVVG
jgi:hypothetical protein